MKYRSRNLLYVMGTIYILIITGLILLIYNIPAIYANIDKERIDTINQQVNQALNIPNDVQKQEALEHLLVDNNMELVVLSDTGFTFKTVPITDFDELSTLIDPDVLSYHSAYKLVTLTDQFEVWVAIYHMNAQPFFELSMNIITLAIIILTITITILVFMMFRKLIRPLNRLRTNIFKLKEYRLSEVDSANSKTDYDVLSEELSEFTEDLQGKMDTINVNYTRLERELQARQERHVYNSRLVVATVHDMKTPINLNVLAINKLQKKYYQDKTLSNELEALIENNEQIIHDINDTIVLVNSDDKDRRNEQTEVNVVTIIRDTIRLFLPIFRERNISALFDGPRELFMCTNELHLKQVLHNVISNACQYADIGGAFEITLNDSDGMITIEAYNDKVDVSAIDFEQVFNLFYRAEMTEHSYGSGVGLFTIKSMVEELQGTCRFEPIGNGVQLMITLPMKKEYRHEA